MRPPVKSRAETRAAATAAYGNRCKRRRCGLIQRRREWPKFWVGSPTRMRGDAWGDGVGGETTTQAPV